MVYRGCYWLLVYHNRGNLIEDNFVGDLIHIFKQSKLGLAIKHPFTSENPHSAQKEHLHLNG